MKILLLIFPEFINICSLTDWCLILFHWWFFLSVYEIVLNFYFFFPLSVFNCQFPFHGLISHLFHFCLACFPLIVWRISPVKVFQTASFSSVPWKVSWLFFHFGLKTLAVFSPVSKFHSTAQRSCLFCFQGPGPPWSQHAFETSAASI